MVTGHSYESEPLLVRGWTQRRTANRGAVRRRRHVPTIQGDFMAECLKPLVAPVGARSTSLLRWILDGTFGD
jgi:hypothetical protein